MGPVTLHDRIGVPNGAGNFATPRVAMYGLRSRAPYHVRTPRAYALRADRVGQLFRRPTPCRLAGWASSPAGQRRASWPGEAALPQASALRAGRVGQLFWPQGLGPPLRRVGPGGDPRHTLRGGVARRTAISSRPWPDSSVRPTPRETQLCCCLASPAAACCRRRRYSSAAAACCPARRRSSSLRAPPAL
eukprot:SM000021S06462  [mRNA]  locus=s21:414905:415677:- [translate_table: standard]